VGPFLRVLILLNKQCKFRSSNARTGEMRNSYKILVGKPEGKRSLGRPRCRCGNNAKINLKETGCEVVDWIHVVQCRVQWRASVNTTINLRVS